MKVLAVDQSTTASGWCICNITENFQMIDYGCFKSNSNSMNERIIETWNFFETMIDDYKPSLILLEDVFCSTNKNTFKQLSELLGGLEELANIKGVEVKVIPPSEWRKILNTSSKTKRKELKQLSKKYVLETFNLETSDDVSDSICIGYYWYSKEKGEIQ